MRASVLSLLIFPIFLISCGKASDQDQRSKSNSSTTGTFDSNFYNNFGTGFNGTVNALIYVGGNQVIAAGDFTSFKGSSLNRIAKISQDGELSNSFKNTISSGFNGSVRALALASDGGILVGGDFTNFKGTSVSRLVKISSSGNLDTSFMSNLGNGPNDSVYAIHVSSSGEIYVGGNFNQISSRSSPGIARILSNGSLDTSFSAYVGIGANDSVFSIATTSTSKILVGGKFNSFNGSSSKGFVRLNSNGSTDSSLASITSSAFNDSVFSLLVDSLSRVIFGGNFSNFSSYSVGHFIRLNSAGAPDTQYVPSGGAYNGSVRTMLLQGDGKIIVGGDFTTLSGQTRNYLSRLNSDLSVDSDFNSALGTGPNSTVKALCFDGEGKLFVGGSFTSFDSNVVGYLLRLQ